MSSTIKGTDDLRKRLLELDDKLRKKEVQKILKKGSAYIQREMRKEAPTRGGSRKLEKSISDLEEKRPRQYGVSLPSGTAVRIVGPRKKGKKGVSYAHFVDQGVRGGVFKSPDGFVIPVGGSLARVKQITRNPVPGQRFIEKSFNASAKEAENRILAYIDEIVQR